MSILGRIFSRGGHADYRRGIELFNEKRFAEAADTFSAALAAIDDPTDPHYSLGRFYIAEARVQLGRQLFQDDCPEESRTQLQLALGAGYRYPDLHFSLAEACGRLKDWPAAVESCRQALELNPRYVDARAYLAWVLLMDGQRDAAVTELRELVGEGFSISEDLDDPAAAAVILGNLKDRQESEVAVQAALDLYRLGDLERALPALESAVVARPRYADLRCKLGSLYASRGQLQQARTQLDEAVAINPEYVDAHLHRARLALREGRLTDAEEILDEVGRQSSNEVDVATLALRAYVRLLAGAIPEALDLLGNVEDTSGELLHLRALMAWTIGDVAAAHRDFHAAAGGSSACARFERDRHWLCVESSEFVEAVLEGPSDAAVASDTGALGAPGPETAVLLGREAASQGNWSDAANHWTNAISMGDVTSATRAWLGEAELILGEPVVAAEHLRAALDGQPLGPWWDALGQAWDGQGDVRADECFRLAVASPQPPLSARLRFAATLLGSGKLVEAREQYAEIQAVHPYHPVARFVLEPEFFLAA